MTDREQAFYVVRVAKNIKHSTIIGWVVIVVQRELGFNKED